MDFVLIGPDGEPVPPVVLPPEEQARRVFYDIVEALLSEAVDPDLWREFSLSCITFAGFDEEPLAEDDVDELVYCAECPYPRYPGSLDEDGICEDCHDRRIRDALSTPPFCRTAEDWALLEAHGYVDPVDAPYDPADYDEDLND